MTVSGQPITIGRKHSYALRDGYSDWLLAAPDGSAQIQLAAGYAA
jgi:hypothetical protein